MQPRVPYRSELDELRVTLDAASSARARELREQLLRLACGPAKFVGTGGTLALAHLASDLHEALSGQPAAAITPLELLQAPTLSHCGALLFSARAKHPDAQLALRRLGSGDFRPAVLVTHRDLEDAEELVGPDVAVVQVTPPAIREGFLATNSVMAMAAALLLAFDESPMPKDVLDLPRETDCGSDAWANRHLLVVYPPRLRPVAVDIETRCSELGVAWVQLSDLRNVAHGRHTGLSRNAADTTVLVLSDRDSKPLADAVADVLTLSEARQVRWHSNLAWPHSVLPLLAASMRLAGQYAAGQGFDAARPGVPVYGRRLYNLPVRRMLQRAPATPALRKLQALGGGSVQPGLEGRYQVAFNDWIARIEGVAFGAIVLDYDGTVVSTSERRALPRPEVQHALLRVIEQGLILGFASGRGKSLHADLRAWIPEQHWPDITVGLYNGAIVMQLVEEMPDVSLPTPLMEAATARLSEGAFADLWSVEPRSGQVTVEIKDHAFFHAGRLAELVRELLVTPPALPVVTVASGHSVDVIAESTTKVAIVDRVRTLTLGEVLVCGDQGDIGGNDFELLASTPWSVSVDRCSGHPDHCWPADLRGRRGPVALAALLNSMKVKKGTGRLKFARTPAAEAQRA